LAARHDEAAEIMEATVSLALAAAGLTSGAAAGSKIR
jgi:hypothetical protein